MRIGNYTRYSKFLPSSSTIRHAQRTQNTYKRRTASRWNIFHTRHVVGFCYGIFFQKQVYELENAPVIFAVCGAIGAVIAVIGDLTASAIKRNNDIKDYGKLIPGHGGILDRFDSIIFTAPVVYYCFIYMASNLGG